MAEPAYTLDETLEACVALLEPWQVPAQELQYKSRIYSTARNTYIALKTALRELKKDIATGEV